MLKIDVPFDIAKCLILLMMESVIEKLKLQSRVFFLQFFAIFDDHDTQMEPDK